MRRCVICIFPGAVTFDVWEEINAKNVRLYGEQLACLGSEKSPSDALERCLKWAKLLLCQEVSAVAVFSLSPQVEKLLRETGPRLSLTVRALSEEERFAFLTTAFQNERREKNSLCCYLNEQRPALLLLEDGAVRKLSGSSDNCIVEGLSAKELLVTGHSAGQIVLLAAVLFSGDALSVHSLSRLAEMVSSPSRETADLLERLFPGDASLSRDLMTLRKLCQDFSIQQVKLIPWNPSACLPDFQTALI